MTSLVKARSLAPLDEVFAALHPSASVTGAPKVRTMELLKELEPSPRGIYTGAIGHVPPDGLARFNVAIRTATIDRGRSNVTFGIGSGIVWDSNPDAEYAECLLKGSVLGAPAVAFDLLETLLWTPAEGYYLLERHLERVRASAEYFSRPLSLPDVVDVLNDVVAGAASPMRIRLVIGDNGSPSAEATPHVRAPGPLKIAVASDPVDPSDVFLFHKTTNRHVYERARTAVKGVDEVLLWNTEGEITEATTSNVIVELHGRRVTPPVECGLLAGTYRAMLLHAGEIVEQKVEVAAINRASRIWLVNSVQGMREATIIEPAASVLR